MKNARLLQALVTPTQHYKMYKSGRHWLLMGLTTVTLGLASCLTTQVSAADTTTAQTTATTPTTTETPTTAAQASAPTSTAATEATTPDSVAPVTSGSAAPAATPATAATTPDPVAPVASNPATPTTTDATANPTPTPAVPDATATPEPPVTATTTVETTYHFIPATGSITSPNVLTGAYTNATTGEHYTVIDRTVTNTIDENGTWTNITGLTDDNSTQLLDPPSLEAYGYTASGEIAVDVDSVIYSAATEHYGSDGNLYYGDQPGSWPAISDLERVDGQGPAALAHTLNDLNAWQWPSATDKQRPATEFWFYVFYQPNEETLLINYTDSETGEVLKTYDVPTRVDSVVATELYSPQAHYYVTNFSPIVRITNNGLAAQVVNIPVTQNSQTITRRYTDAAGHALLPTETHTGAPFTTLNLAGDTYLQDYPNSPYHLNIAASTISFTSNAFVGLVAQPAESFSYDHLSDFLSFADDGTASFPGITDQVTANTIDIPFGPDGITIPLSLFSPEHVASATPTAQDQAALRLEIASATNDYQALLTKWLTSDEAGLTAADQAFVTAKTTAFTNNAAQLDWSDSDAITLFLWDAYNWLFAMNTYNNITVNYVYEVDPIGDPTTDPQTRTQSDLDLTVTPKDYYDNTKPGQVDAGVLVKTKVQVPDAVSVTPADYYDNTQPGQVADGVLVKAKVQVPDAISVTPADYYDNTQPGQVADGVLVKTKVQVPDAVSVTPTDYYNNVQADQIADGVLVKTKVQVPAAVSVTPADYYDNTQAGQVADGVLVKTKVQVPAAVSVTPADYYNTTKTQAPDTDTNHHEASSTTPTTGQTTTPRNSTPAPATAASTSQPATTVPATTAPTATVTPAHTAAQPTATPAATAQATTLPQTGAADETALLVLGGLTILGSIGLLGATKMRKRHDGSYDL
ncbi:KxYKxGKxW signal peptide domain-containing protein [Loigolactobacillus bifermentans]|uniref:Gram-positive cocci surface proteins LPxTG domain-containing protein n=1 Tax=Loigolactobacillus bifermentans DSM 20003 TaxID=1423726 RepID=A0A0R1GXV0_9LACO|nr:KxYKxGKxW signal peptide domain-containing protein [Loigolactobacillus bifermentans]KRK36034.1 hypothetical protein FC07_GL000081 [Loigolactobacillus bifermentans DSM 20003]QGG61045.1 LPXTG cell wall anchor domain-containing protein [Loigolactobacillus bifermentans]